MGRRPVFVFEDTLDTYRSLMRLYIRYRDYCRIRRGPLRIGLDRQIIRKGEIAVEPSHDELYKVLASRDDGRLIQVETINAKR